MAFEFESSRLSLALFQAQVCRFRMALGDVDNNSGFVPLESFSSLEFVVSYSDVDVVAIRIIPNPPFAYLQVLGLSPPSRSVISVSTLYECQSILFCNVISIQTIRHNLYFTSFRTILSLSKRCW